MKRYKSHLATPNRITALQNVLFSKCFDPAIHYTDNVIATTQSELI